MLTGKFTPFRKGVRIGVSDRRKRHNVKNDPERLRPQLEAADQGDAVRHQRNDDDGADEIADRPRDSEAHLQRGGENDRLDRKEDEGEGGVDQRGDGRADVTEAGPARQEIDIDAAFGGMIGNRQAAAEDNDADDQNGSGGVGDAIIERDRAADCFQRQERDRAQGGVGDPCGGPAPGALGREAQRVVFQRLVGNPLIILAPDAVYPLPPCHFSTPDPTPKARAKSTSLFCGAIYAILRICALHNFSNPRLANNASLHTNGVTMSDEIKRGLQSPLRRKLLMGMAALPAISMLPRPSFADVPATSVVNTTGLAVTDTEVTVGILHSVTGTMSISETGSVEAEKLAIEQINAAGGVLGRKIKFIQEDGASDWPTFAEKAKKLLVNDKCAAVMGCWTSASRKAVLPVFEQYNGMLYYPTFYEGLEQSKNVIYTGQEATQQIIAGLDWVNKTKNAKSFYLLGSDYIWPRTSNKIARKHIEGHLAGCKVVGEEYFPLGHTQFNSVINKIKLTKPDVIYAIIVGGSNVAFYKQLKAAGIDLSKQTLLTISVTEDEIDGIGGENIAGAFACMKYFQSLDNANNKTFVPAFKKMWGEKTVIGDVTQAAYLGPWLWKLTVEKAGSFDVDKIAAASPGVEFKGAPEGYVRIHENHHLWSKTRVGKAKLDGQFELIFETTDLVEPDPFPKGYQ